MARRRAPPPLRRRLFILFDGPLLLPGPLGPAAIQSSSLGSSHLLTSTAPSSSLGLSDRRRLNLLPELPPPFRTANLLPGRTIRRWPLPPPEGRRRFGFAATAPPCGPKRPAVILASLGSPPSGSIGPPPPWPSDWAAPRSSSLAVPLPPPLLRPPIASPPCIGFCRPR